MSVGPNEESWDAVIVGAGVGAATAGFALARAGQKVLFVEKGRVPSQAEAALRGRYAEEFFRRSEIPGPQHREILAQAGRYADEVEDHSFDRPRRYIPFIGSGPGGSSALYGMAMERFLPRDFAHRERPIDAPDAEWPDGWPITYEDLRPYYVAAEQLYGVRGTPDPLRRSESFGYCAPPPPITEANRELLEFLSRKGLHPYRLPLACDFAAGCEGCQGYLCKLSCKNDSNRVCLGPAVRKLGAVLIDECEALRFEARGDTVKGLVCQRRGKTITFRAPLFVLGAGALHTPVLLLNSASADWPQGLANSSGLVGRNLMRHCIDLYAVFPKRSKVPLAGNIKEIAFNDLYEGKQSLGSVQSFGRLPPASVLVAQILHDVAEQAGTVAGSLAKLGAPVLRQVLKRLLGRSLLLATTLEDLPYLDNRVFPGSRAGSVALKYRLRPYEQRRVAAFRNCMREILKGYRFMLLKQAENNDRIAHACGTCRFGTDPRRSVLDADNRAHGVSNLYVVDSSFFPTSAAINPSLTIAANALRVADRILGVGSAKASPLEDEQATGRFPISHHGTRAAVARSTAGGYTG